MKKTLFMACVLAPALACAGESYRVQNAAEFQTAWAAATDGDTIAVAGDVDWSALTAPLQDKDGSICVSAEGDSKIVWQGPGAAIPLPKGLQLQNITLFNAPGALWQGTDIAIGQGVRLIQSQGVDSAVIVAAGGKADVMAGAGFDTLASPGMGGAIRIGDGATAAIHGGVTFDNNAAQGLGGAIAVENQTASGDTANLSLIADTGDIIFSGNQSEAVSENGAWLGFPNDIYLGENASMRLSAAEGREIRLNGGVESADGSARIVKTGKGSASLGEGGFYVGSLSVQEGSVAIAENANWGDASPDSLVSVSQGASLILRQGSTLNASSLRLEQGSAFAMDGATLESTLNMAGGTLAISAPSAINSPAVTLSSGNTWTFRMSDALLASPSQPLLQFSPQTSITQGSDGALTLNVDFSQATSAQGAQKLAIVSGLNQESMDILKQSAVTCTDSQGTRQTSARLDDQGCLNLDELLPHFTFDRPGRAAVNALYSSAEALRSLDAALHGQMPLHTDPQFGPRLWGSALGHYDNASSAYRYSGGGYAVGVTYAMGDRQAGKGQTLAGVAIGQLFGTNKARLDGGSDAAAQTDQTSHMLALYGRRAWADGSALDVTLAYGQTDNDYASAAHSGSWNDGAFLASVRFSQEIRHESGFCMTPFIGLEYVAASQDAAVFSGATGDWGSDGADLGVLSLPVGIAFRRSFEAGNGKIFTPQLELLYRGDLYRENPSAVMTDGYATWTSEGSSPARNAFEVW